MKPFLIFELSGPQEQATHCSIHATTPTGGMAKQLSADLGQGPQSVFAIEQMTADFILATWGEGRYKFQLRRPNDATGKWHGLGSTGAVQIKAPPPGSAPPPVVNGKRKKSGGGYDVLTMYTQLQRDARAEAAQMYGQQAERDRQFMTAILASTRAPTIDQAALVREVTAAVQAAQPAAAVGAAEEEEEYDDSEPPAWLKPLLPTLVQAATAIAKKIGDLPHASNEPLDSRPPRALDLSRWDKPIRTTPTS